MRSPATLLDLAKMIGVTSSFRWAVARQMMQVSNSFTFLNSGEVFAVAGFYPLNEGGYEGWFNFSTDASAYMGFVVRQVRLTLASGAYDGTVTICTSKAGARLARLCGFEFQTNIQIGEVWAYGGFIDGIKRAQQNG